MFKSQPRVFGNTGVFAGVEQIGYATGKVKQASSDLFLLPIKIEKKYSRAMTSNMCAVVINGVVELRQIQQTSGRPLHPGASLVGYGSEWEYNWSVLGSKGNTWVSQLNKLLNQ